MRLINADEIEYKSAYRENWLKATGEEQLMVWKSDIDEMPAINAVQVIRCKDCKYWNREDGMFPDIDGEEIHDCNGTVTWGWDFCSRAKEKDYETD